MDITGSRRGKTSLIITVAAATADELQASRGIDFGSPRVVVTGIRCVDNPVCALVLAAFGSQSWRDITSAPCR